MWMAPNGNCKESPSIEKQTTTTQDKKRNCNTQRRAVAEATFRTHTDRWTDR